MSNSPQSLQAQLEAAKRRIKDLERAELAQLYLTAIVESADDAIISKTLESIVTSWNRGAERIFGYTADEMIGQSITKLIPPDHDDEERQIIARLRKGERIEHYETQRVRKDGSIIDISLTVSPIRDMEGNIIGASKIARDISERKRFQERELAARKQAEAANRAKDEFLATVSHELRTPLTAVLGWVKMMAAGPMDAATSKKALDVIERNVRTQAKLIEDLLDDSRIISGKLRIAVRPIDPSAVISAAVDVIKAAAEAKHIRIQTVLDSSVGEVNADFERLQQVLWNLLSNAVKFTPNSGSIRVELSRGRTQIEIAVTDTGIGMESDFLPYVFNRFSQADTSITRLHGGIGVGLAIAKSLVELHGGTISVQSAGPGKGSTFTISLPIAAVAQRTVSETGLEFRQLHDLEGVKILVVDDEPDACEMLLHLFRLSGAQVEVATSAEEALRVCE